MYLSLWIRDSRLPFSKSCRWFGIVERLARSQEDIVEWLREEYAESQHSKSQLKSPRVLENPTPFSERLAALTLVHYLLKIETQFNPHIRTIRT